VSPQFNIHGKSTFFSQITSKWTGASTRFIEGYMTKIESQSQTLEAIAMTISLPKNWQLA